MLFFFGLAVFLLNVLPMCKLVEVFKVQTWIFIMVLVTIMKNQKENNLGYFKNEELFYTFRGSLGVFDTL